MSNKNYPHKHDVVLGGQSQTGGLVLGGVDGLRQRYQLPDPVQRLAAVREASKYGRSGVRLVIQALQDPDEEIQKAAYVLLRHRQDAETQQALSRFEFYRFFTNLRTLKGGYQTAISSDGNLIGVLNKSLKVYDLKATELLFRIPRHPDGWELFILGNDRRTVVRSTAGDQHRLELWREDELQHTLYGHAAPIRALALTEHSQICASGSEDGMIKLWNVADGKALWTIHSSLVQGSHTGAILSLSFSTNGRTLVSSGADGKVKIWNLQTRDRPRTIPVRGLRTLAISSEGLLAGAAWDGKIRLWQLETGEFVQLFDRQAQDHLLAFSPDGRTLAVASALTIYLYSLRTGRLVCVLTGHEQSIEAMRFNEDGQTLISSSQDKTIRIWGVP